MGRLLLCLCVVASFGCLLKVRKLLVLVGALFIESKSSSAKDDLYVRLNDMAVNEYIHVENIAGDIQLDWAAVTLSGGSVNGVVVLY